MYYFSHCYDQILDKKQKNKGWLWFLVGAYTFHHGESNTAAVSGVTWSPCAPTQDSENDKCCGSSIFPFLCSLEPQPMH